MMKNMGTYSTGVQEVVRNINVTVICLLLSCRSVYVFCFKLPSYEWVSIKFFGIHGI